MLDQKSRTEKHIVAFALMLCSLAIIIGIWRNYFPKKNAEGVEAFLSSAQAIGIDNETAVWISKEMQERQAIPLSGWESSEKSRLKKFRYPNGETGLVQINEEAIIIDDIDGGKLICPQKVTFF